MTLEELHTQLFGTVGSYSLKPEHRAIYSRYRDGQKYILGRDAYSAAAACVIALSYAYEWRGRRITVLVDPSWDTPATFKNNPKEGVFSSAASLFRDCLREIILNSKSKGENLTELLKHVNSIYWGSHESKPLNWVAFGYVSSKDLEHWMKLPGVD